MLDWISYMSGLDYIDIIMLAVGLFAVGKLTVSFKKNTLSLRRYLVWVGFWLVVIFVVFHPAFSDAVAVFLGVSRGTDAAFFIAILLIFYVIFKLLMRIENLEQNLTKIVREIAFRNGNRSDKME